MQVTILVPPDAHALEVAGLSEMFDEANRCTQDGPAPYSVLRVGGGRDPIPCSCGLTILPDCSFSDANTAPDTLILAASYGVPSHLPPVMLDWVRGAAGQARRYGAVCTGAFILGDAGLLSGRHVTTHWEYAPILAERFPKAHVDPDRIFVRDGPMFTSAGVTAALDLALDLIEEDLGRDVALRVARRLVIFLKRSGGQSQYSIHLATQKALRPPIEAVQALVREHPTDDLTVGALARHAGMSERSLSRVFRQQTGMTVNAYVEASRIDFARRLLEDSDLPLKTIAALGGFGNTHAMRRAFLHRLGVTSTDYRSRFKSSRRSS
ncbi:MAG: GlxA family transcriptional regulator [Rhodopila sp.]|jgi:transcriptional regulator GlxA family with amidase domain